MREIRIKLRELKEIGQALPEHQFAARVDDIIRDLYVMEEDEEIPKLGTIKMIHGGEKPMTVAERKWAEGDKEIEVALKPEERSPPSSPDDLRENGWMVAVHNDYRQNGASFTFWLLTKGQRCIKGEGSTDSEALNRIRAGLEVKHGDRARLVHVPDHPANMISPARIGTECWILTDDHECGLLKIKFDDRCTFWASPDMLEKIDAS